MLRKISPLRDMNSEQAFFYEIVTGSLRLLLLVISCLFFAAMCTRWLEGVDVWTKAVELKQNARPLLTWIPTYVWVFRVPFQDWHYARYLLAPVAAFLMVFISSI